MPVNILVTGGAGYIGSHTAKAIAEHGWRPIIFDNLANGFREAVRWGEFKRANIHDGRALRAVIDAHDVRALVHFAGAIEVGRSVNDPSLFWHENVTGFASVLAAARDCGVKRIVFSSSAAVYGSGDGQAAGAPLRESAPKSPSSPYGDTKLAGERMLAAHCVAYGASGMALRYFNAAGADPGGLIGEAHEPETHLIPLAIGAALGRRAPLTVFGDDYPTPDGTAVRDYVHVSDLAAAHVAALDAEMAPGAFEALNVGAGRGASVLEVLSTVAKVTGVEPSHRFGPRRPGDPPVLLADITQIQRRLAWRPYRSELDVIVRDAAAWHAQQAYGMAPA